MPFGIIQHRLNFKTSETTFGLSSQRDIVREENTTFLHKFATTIPAKTTTEYVSAIMSSKSKKGMVIEHTTADAAKKGSDKKKKDKDKEKGEKDDKKKEIPWQNVLDAVRCHVKRDMMTLLKQHWVSSKNIAKTTIPTSHRLIMSTSTSRRRVRGSSSIAIRLVLVPS
jgi:hypothetical protein